MEIKSHRLQKSYKNLHFPLEIWYRIFRYYLPDYEKYKILFICKNFNALIKSLELLPFKFPSKFIRLRYYFIVTRGIYYYGDSENFLIMNLAQRKFDSSIRPIFIARWVFDEMKYFMFTTTFVNEIYHFFQNYCMPIHYVQLENELCFQREIGIIIGRNFDYGNKQKIQWVLNKTYLTNLQNSNFEIKKIFFYNNVLDPNLYIDIYHRIRSISKVSANSFATIFVLKCFLNICIVDVILTHTERNLPNVVYFE